MFFSAARFYSLLLIIFAHTILSAQTISNIETCWAQKQILTQKQTVKLGKTRNLYLSTVYCKDDNKTLGGVEIEYKLLINNQNRFAHDDNFNPNYYETRLVYLDADELEAMIFALQKLQNSLNSPPQDSTEWQYTSRAGFKIGAAYLPTWQKWTVYIEFPDKKKNKISRKTLLEFAQLLQQAQNHLKA